MVEQRQRLQRRAEHEHRAAGLHELSEWRARTVRMIRWLVCCDPFGALADRSEPTFGMRAVPRAGPCADAFRQAAVIRLGFGYFGVKRRRVAAVGRLAGTRPLVEVVGVVLPAGHREKRASGPEELKEGRDDGIRPADDESERA